MPYLDMVLSGEGNDEGLCTNGEIVHVTVGYCPIYMLTVVD
jgi:hypothetical protein